MSNNWKKRVNDFFFDEIEVDTEEKVDKQQSNPIYRTHPTFSKSVNTKVTYQYPKNNQAPFRFPVIPDAKKHENRDKVRPARQRSQISRKNKQRTPRKNDVLKSTYQRKKFAEELEEVPAYIRRQQAREQLEKQRQRDEKTIQPEETYTYKDYLKGHTRPDELDRVFSIRDGQTTSHKYDREQADIGAAKLHKNRSYSHHQVKGNSDKREEETADRQQRKNKHSLGSMEDSTNAAEEETQQIHQPNKIRTETMETAVYPTSDTGYNKTIASKHASPRTTKVVPDYLLNDPLESTREDEEWVTQQEHLLNQTLEHFKVDAKVVKVTKGPTVTRFEIQPALGVKVSRIRGLADDIKLNMAARDIRMEAPIPGKHTIGIEVPNEYPQMVSLQEIIETNAFKQSTSDLTIALGLTLEGDPLITTIDQMPHGLIAGATGSGKSVCINSIILSLLYKTHHEDVKFMMIDPKMVELTPYNGIPHLISPVITDVKAATMALKWAVDEMESRYEKLAEAGVRNLERYNTKMMKEQRPEEKLPYVVIIIDELADLMIVSPQEVEDAICRIAQKARACGMHLLVATQRPSVDVITGLIKSNIPTRIAFSVSSQVDSRTILDSNGAEKLLGKGDMLFVENGTSKSVRLQGPFVSDDEIDRVANYARSIAEPTYLFEQEQLLLEVENEDEDELLQEVIAFVIEHGQASTSLLQRRFRIGYNRAARLIDSLEHKGIVSAANGSKPREILVTQTQIDEVLY